MTNQYHKHEILFWACIKSLLYTLPLPVILSKYLHSIFTIVAYRKCIYKGLGTRISGRIYPCPFDQSSVTWVFDGNSVSGPNAPPLKKRKKGFTRYLYECRPIFFCTYQCTCTLYVPRISSLQLLMTYALLFPMKNPITLGFFNRLQLTVAVQDKSIQRYDRHRIRK